MEISCIYRAYVSFQIYVKNNANKDTLQKRQHHKCRREIKLLNAQIVRLEYHINRLDSQNQKLWKYFEQNIFSQFEENCHERQNHVADDKHNNWNIHVSRQNSNNKKLENQNEQTLK